ncbi:MAG: MFS transporter [Telmatospirillum sp.]|nr:MFS transporter [Telmatospirillum sp.]
MTTIPDGPAGKRQETVLVAILGAAGLVSAADNWIVAPILPPIADDLGVTVARAVTVLTAYMIPYGLLQPLHGFLSEGYGRLRLLRRLMLGLAAGTMGCALAPSLSWLCAGRCLTGLFAAGLIAVSLAAIGDRVPPDRRQAAVGRFMGIVFLGQAVAVGLGGMVAEFLSWRTVFTLFTMLALLVFGLLLRLPADRPRPPTTGFIAELVRALNDPRGRLVYSLAFVTGYLLLGLYGFAGAYLQQDGGLSPLQAGAVLMLFGVASLMAGSAVGHVSRRAGRQGVALLGATLGMTAAVMLACSSDWRIGMMAVMALGLGYVFVQSTLATLAFDIGSSGLSSGLVGLGLFGGGGISSAVGGVILATAGYHLLWIAATLGAAVLIAAILGCRRAFS